MTGKSFKNAEAPFARRSVVAWCLYDWANSPFPAVVTTFVFAAYFTQAVADSPTVGTGQWGAMQGTAALLVALASPLLGAIADHGGRRKVWLAACTVAMIAGSAMLWFVHPQVSDAALMLWLVGIAVVAFEIGMVFYNAMLPGLAPENWLGRVSGWAWGLGYFGGLVCLAVILFIFIQVDTPPFGLDKEQAQHVRIAGPLVAAWIALFSIPVFLFVPERSGEGRGAAAAMRAGLVTLWQTLRHLRGYALVLRFLLARMLYIDGINTLFIFGGIYAAGTIGMDMAQVAMFGLVLNATAGIGAFVFGWIDDVIGAKPTVLIALVGIVAVGIPILMVQSTMWFWILGALLGIFFGPAQAASRSMMARIAPPGMETEMFGLYALSGKATAFIGPWLVGLVTLATGSQRWGLATVLPFVIAGGLLLLTVPIVRSANAESDASR